MVSHSAVHPSPASAREKFAKPVRSLDLTIGSGHRCLGGETCSRMDVPFEILGICLGGLVSTPTKVNN